MRKIDIHEGEFRALRKLIECCADQLASAKDRTAIANLARRLALADK
jgi:hypothetical protein